MLGKVQSELAKLSVFPAAATVIGRACPDHQVTGGRLSSRRAQPLQAGGRGREGGREDGEKKQFVNLPLLR